MGHDAFLHADDEDDGKFEPLRLVEGYERYGIGALADVVGVAYEADPFEECGERVVLAIVEEVFRHRLELADVLHALLAALGVVLDVVAVPGAFQDGLDERRGLVLGALFGEIVDHGLEFLQGVDRSRGEGGDVVAGSLEHLGGLVDCREEGGPVFPSEAVKLAHGALADAARRDVHDASEAHVVVVVGDQAEVGDEVLDLLALVELDAADEVVGNVVSQAHLLERAGLGVDAVHDGDVGPLVAPAHEALDLADDELRLVVLVVALVDDDGDSPAQLGEEVLLQALAIGCDDSLGGFEYRFRGAVVLFEGDELGVGEVLLEAEDVADVGVAPRVDRLVGVADDAEVAVLARQLLGDLVLGDVGVLELVDHDVDVAVAVALGHVGMLPQERVRLEDEVVEVEGRRLGEEGLVPFVDAVNDLLVVVGLLEAISLHADELALGAGDGGEDIAGRELLGVDVALFHRALDERRLVGLVVDGVVLVEAEEIAVSSKDPGAEGVEGADGGRTIPISPSK